MKILSGRWLALLVGVALVSGAGSAFAGQAKPADPPPVRVGGDIKPPVKIKDGPLVYPTAARNSKVQGVVIVEATIGIDGKITATKVIRSIAQLDDAAVKSIKMREYKPTLVNGVAVPVIMTMPVVFTPDSGPVAA